MQTPGMLDHFRTEIDAHAIARLEAGEHIAGPAAEFKDTQSFRDEEAQIAKVLRMEELRTLTEEVPLFGHPRGVVENGRFTG
jgi:hypothetical protein